MLNKDLDSVYICLEGLKGAGKTTLFNYLVSRLEEENVDFSTVSPTRSTGESSLIERLFIKYPSLKERRFPRIFLYAHRSNFAAKNADWSKPLILGERSLTTSYATKWSSSPLRKWFNLSVINLLENKIKAPDHVIYLDVPYEVLRNRIEKRDKARDIDDTDSRLKEMETAYFEMMDNCHINRILNVKWHRISGEGDVVEIGEKILGLMIKLSAKENIEPPLVEKAN